MQGYRKDIDGLRTIAVVPVVLFHAGLGLTGGFVGVDIFFVISGFLITGIIFRDIESQKFSILRFYERRLRRLYPALFAMLAATFLAALLFMIPSDLLDFGHSVMATTIYGANFFFWLSTGYFNEAAHLKPLLHTWSLAVEEQFYVFFPPALWAISRILKRRGIIIVLGVLALASFALSVWLTPIKANFAFYLLPTRAWELALGSLLALGAFPSLAGRARLAGGLSLAAVVMIAVAVITYTNETVFPGSAALWPCLGATLLIWTGMSHQGLVAKALSSAPMVFIGKISYSLYLWHWPVIVFARYGGGETMSLPLGLFCIALSFVLAYLSWRFVEEPVRRNTFFQSKKIVFWGSGIASILAIILGAGTVMQRNTLSRLDPQTMAMLDKSQYLHADRACHKEIVQRAIDGKVCVRGAEGLNPSFVLVGDSHADALSPAIFAAAHSLGLQGWQFTGPGFVPMIGVATRGHSDNAPATQALIEFLREHKEAKTIYLTGYWQHYVTGYTYRHFGTVLVDSQSNKTGTEHNAAAVTAGLGRLFAKFPERQFVLLDDVPSGTALHLSHYARGVSVPWHAPTTSLSQATVTAQRASFEPVLKALADHHPNAEYRPVLAALCASGDCPLFDASGAPIFRDGDHLSAKGALVLTDEIAGMMAPFALSSRSITGE